MALFGRRASAADGVEALPEEQLADLVRQRLQPSDDHGLEATVPGVPSVLALDLPTHVAVPKRSFWEARGGVERWAAVGLRNLATLVGAADIEHHRVQRDGAEFSVLLGESFFTASLALVLDDVMGHHDPAADLRHGVLVAVPNRHQLVWRAVDGPSVVAALAGMAGFTAMGYDEGAGPLSRHVFWRHEGQWEQLAAGPHGEPVARSSPAFAAVLDKLAG
jgi:hypothetical protein